MSRCVGRSSDSITWRRFCRIGLDGSVPHPTTLMKLTTRCGSAAVDGLNEALLAKAAEAKLLRTNRIRVDTTVVPANVAYPTDSGLLAKAIRRIAATGKRIQAAGGATRTRVRDRSRAAGQAGARDRRQAADPLGGGPRRGAGHGARGSPGSWPSWPPPPPRRPNGCWATRNGRCAGPGPRPRSCANVVCAMRRRGGGAGGWPARSTTWQKLLDATRPDRGADPPAGRGYHSGWGDAAGQPARWRCPPDRQGPAGRPVEFGHKAQIVDNDDGVVLDHTVEQGNPPDAPQLAPAVARVREAGRTRAAHRHRRPRLRRSQGRPTSSPTSV